MIVISSSSDQEITKSLFIYLLFKISYIPFNIFHFFLSPPLLLSPHKPSLLNITTCQLSSMVIPVTRLLLRNLDLENQGLIVQIEAGFISVSRRTEVEKPYATKGKSVSHESS